MGSRFTPRETEHYDLGEGDWVEVRSLNYGDRLAIEGALADPETLKFSATRNEAANVTMLLRAVRAWGGPGFGCDCGALRSPHANTCAVEAITYETIASLNVTGERLLSIVGDREERLRRVRVGDDPNVSPSSTSPSWVDEGAAVKTAETSPLSSESGTSSAPITG